MDPVTLLEEAKGLQEEIISLRRKIHQNPELSYKEYETSRLIKEYLESLGVEVRSGVGLPTAVVGVIRGEGRGRTVALRADMDALPVTEETGLPFASKRPGVMHACGHDAHVAMLLGVAKLLAEHRKELRGEVRLLFQPAEEDGGRGGALPMIEAGAMEGVDYVFGIHVMSKYPSGTFATRKGPIMACPDSFRIEVIGRGGHGSAPHETVDPVHVSALIIVALQGIRSRLVDPLRPFVLSVTSVHAGTKDNIIPDRAVIEGTIRTLDEETRKRVLGAFHRIVTSTCEAYQAKCSIKFKEDPYPVTVNDGETTERVMGLLSSIPGSKVQETEPVMGGEDFSRFLQRAKGTFVFLGVRNEGKGIVHPNHSPRFTVDEEALKLGTAALALLALKFTET